MKNSRLYWDAENGWLLDVPVAYDQRAMFNIAQWAIPRQVERWRCLPPSEKKEQLANAIRQLEKGLIRQRVVGYRGNGEGDIVLFNSEKEKSDRLILDLGNK